jgi:hypothetical protein
MKAWDWLLDRFDKRPWLIPIFSTSLGMVAYSGVYVLGSYLMGGM